MDTYECEVCRNDFEIERSVAILSPPEHYEFHMCETCFKESV